MEDLLFSCYMNKMKELNGGIWFRFKRLPIWLRIVLVTMGLDVVLFVTITIWFKNLFWVPCFVEIAIVFVTIILGDSYQIRNSKAKLEDYKTLCKSLRNTYAELGITSVEYLIVIKNRMTNKLNKINKTCEKNKQNLSQWIQALVFPAILALFGAVISSEENAEFALSVGMTLLIIILLIIFLAFLVMSVKNILNRIHSEDYETFIVSLQTIIDLANGQIN